MKRQSCTCRAKAQCAAAVSSKPGLSCVLRDGKKGFCCRDVLATKRRTTVLSTRVSVTTSSRLPTGASDNDIRNSL